MFIIIGKILAFLIKNLSLIVGIIEAIIKALAGIVSLTATKKDDALVKTVDTVFSFIKKFLYTISDKLAGRPVTTPN